MTEYVGPFAGRTDAHHVLSQLPELPELGGPEHSDARFIRAVEAWSPSGGGLVLLGPTGCGKTTAAVHLVRRLLATREDATSTAFVLARDLVSDPALVDRARRVRYLVLDDLGREHDPRGVLFGVLDHRHTRYPTIVTSGIRAEDLQDYYKGAFVRRLAEYRGRPVRMVSIFAERSG